MEMTSTLENLDPLMSNYTKIYVELVNDALAEYLYDANLACLKFDIETSKYGLVVRMGGLDDKQHVLLDKVLQTMLELDFDAEHFEIIKKKVEPSELAIHCESVCLLEKEWLITEQLISTENLSIGDLKIFMRKFFSVMHIKCLIHGNANKAAAQKLIEVIERNLPENMLPSHLLRPRDMMLNDGCSYVYPVTYDAHKTSCGVIHLQCPPQCIEDNVLLELFVELFKYKNVTLVRNLTGQGVRFMMHSLNHPIYMERKLEHVIFSIKSILEEMSDKEFERCKKDLAGRRLENCKKMIDQTNKYWTEISSQRQCFDRDRLETDYLKTISKTNVMNFYNDYIYAEGAKRRKLAIHLTSTAEGGAGSDSAKLEEIEPLSIFTDEPKQVENVQSFKSGLATYYPQPIPYQDRPGVDSNRQIYLAQKKPFLDIETILS
ncbi:insulin-degrading enzyme-like isoform X2 [Cloeon dipterum]|uniref:insulin-degrading enzyme-like isoform X2 n=1 Tax=Cloeon dipterum TaxID=197152 RepID=UPI0032207E3D